MAFDSAFARANTGRDFYKILGISKKASDGDIKKAYRTLSREWHPDQNPDNKEEATTKFYDISDAYETLTDPEKRAKYDLGGEDAVNGNGGGGGGGRGGFHRGADPFDQFNTFFQFFGGDGGGGGFGGGQFQQPAPNMYDENSGVTEIGNANDWNTQVVQRSEIVLVDFYSPTCGPCKQLKDEYISVGKTFKGIISIAAVNCAGVRAKQICQSQKVQGYPTLRLFLDDGKQVEFPANQEKSAKNIGNWISSSMPDYSSKIDSEKKLKSFMDAGSSRAMVILFSDKKQTPPLFKSLCRSFKTNIACGVVLEYSIEAPFSFLPNSLIGQVPKTPTLFYVHDSLSLEGETFKGSMTSEILSLFFSRVTSHRSRQVTVDQLTAARGTDCSPADATTCILLLENPKQVSGETTESYRILKQLAERYKSDPVKFFWVDSSKFHSIFDHPGPARLVAYRGKRGKYSAFEGAVEFEVVNSWIDNIVSGGTGLPLAIAKPPRHDEL